jgi:hypothetical protein
MKYNVDAKTIVPPINRNAIMARCIMVCDENTSIFTRIK